MITQFLYSLPVLLILTAGLFQLNQFGFQQGWAEISSFHMARSHLVNLPDRNDREVLNALKENYGIRSFGSQSHEPEIQYFSDSDDNLSAVSVSIEKADHLHWQYLAQPARDIRSHQCLKDGSLQNEDICGQTPIPRKKED